jgi:mannose-6-phosphate isomerase-like protein (cupin superfamily)
MSGAEGASERVRAYRTAAIGPAPEGGLYHEFLRVPALSAGIYRLAAGARDPQSPHAQDELYHVLEGRATLATTDGDVAVAAGSLVYVAAGVEHRFTAIEEDLVVLVLFAPAESADAG